MALNLNRAWRSALFNVLENGSEVSPRGQRTRELLHSPLVVDMQYPVLTVKSRELNYRFMAAEAYWILTGRNTVKDIAPYNKNISQFSDDGITFAGAYGPEIQRQLNFVVSKLAEDPDTRQAVLTIWKQNPPPSKDIPCTVAMSFMIRDGWLHCHTFMRSNDLWLGTPYDVFNFSMLSTLICARYNRSVKSIDQFIRPGFLYLTAASQHLYEQHWETAEKLDYFNLYELDVLPAQFYVGSRAEEVLLERLCQMRERGNESLRWWR